MISIKGSIGCRNVVKIMEHIENLCKLYFYYEAWSYNLIQFLIEGDNEAIESLRKSVYQSGEILKELIPNIHKQINNLNIELNTETVSSSAPGEKKEFNYIYLSVGTLADELNSMFTIKFISSIIEKKMGLKVPKINFLFFYLPPMPSGISNEGTIYTSLGGFYNIRNKRVELNIYPNFKTPEIYENLIHEIFHHIIEEDSILESNEVIIDAYVDEYFEISKDEYQANIAQIINSLKMIIKEKLIIFEHFNNFLNIKFTNEFIICKQLNKEFQRHYEYISQGKIILTPIEPNFAFDRFIVLTRNRHIKQRF